jgi:hypothetical protein
MLDSSLHRLWAGGFAISKEWCDPSISDDTPASVKVPGRRTPMPTFIDIIKILRFGFIDPFIGKVLFYLFEPWGLVMGKKGGWLLLAFHDVLG